MYLATRRTAASRILLWLEIGLRQFINRVLSEALNGEAPVFEGAAEALPVSQHP